jgi:cytoskeletal protein CcmA (bactofilin family)
MSVIDQGLVINGDIYGDQDLSVKGQIKGTIFLKSGSVNIDESGVVEGEILAVYITIMGKFNGKAIALEKLKLSTTAKVEGEIQGANVEIEEGAFFRGNLQVKPLDPVEMDVKNFKSLSEDDYEKLRQWRLRNKVKM